MKRFLSQATLFFLLLAGSLIYAAFFVPSREMRESMLQMVPIKNAMLRDTPSPRIIFVGGSNLSMGLNSEAIAKAFEMPVVNMGLHGGLGLLYMLNEVQPYVRRGDIVVLVPEYEHFHGNLFYGNKEVLGVAFDIMPEKRCQIGFVQWIYLTKFVPNYAAKKLYYLVVNVFDGHSPSAVDACNDFNSYGDYIGHWYQNSETVIPLQPSEHPESLRSKYFEVVEGFVREIRSKDAQIFILPPCLQATSYDNMRFLIVMVENEYRNRGLPLIASTSRYRMADELCSGTPYHLNKKGVDERTRMLIRDLSNAPFKSAL